MADIEIQSGGMRMLWEPISERAQHWSEQNRERLSEAFASPGTECLIRSVQPFLREMRELGFEIPGSDES